MKSERAVDFERAAELVVGAGVSALLTIGTIVYVGRVVGPAEYADFSAALAVVYFVGLALSPVTPTVARVVARLAAESDFAAAAAIRRGILRRLIAIAAAALAIAAVVVIPVARWLNFRSPVTLYLAFVSALLYAVLSVDRGVIQGLFQFRGYNVNVVVESAFRVLLIAALLRRFPHAAFSMVAWTVSSLLAEILIASTLAFSSRGVERQAARWGEFAQMLRPMVLLMLSIAIFQNTDILAAKRWLSPEQAGVYGAASALTRAFGVLFVPLYVLAGPLLTERHARGRSVLVPTLQLSLAFVGLSAAPLIIFALWPRPILTAMYGVSYLDAGRVIAPLAGVTILTYVTLMLTQAPITIADYRFTRLVLAAAFLQIVMLATYHATYSEILASLYVAQGIAFLIVAALLNRPRPVA